MEKNFMIKGWLKILFLPAICIIWMIGWVFYNIESAHNSVKKNSYFNFASPKRVK